ncbi:MAG: hypothetical protein ACLPWF_10040 [Bryobacteraceae bacterium]
MRVVIPALLAISLVSAMFAQNGKPDLSGVWSPEARSEASRPSNDPDANCTLSGVPRIDLGPKPFKILQSPDEVVILYEAYTTFRQVFTDGRPLPEDPQPSWMGYSVGKWEADTLVVETTGFNDKTWLDNAGTRHSESLRVTERFHRRDAGHLDIQITVNDPKTLQRPQTYTEHARLVTGTELHEFICLENRK